jgi:Holliday junction resolvase RusA-like endonuclease
MVTEFFLDIIPPTCTHQQKKIGVRNGKPYTYEPDELKDARQKLTAHLAGYAPKEPYTCGVRLVVKWCFPKGGHRNGEYRTTKPDTDNLQKLLKDVMTSVGFWTDDALVAIENCEKFWANRPGIYIRIDPLQEVR